LVYVYILMVPFGPKFDFSTSINPTAALMFKVSACPLFATSEFGLILLSAEEDILLLFLWWEGEVKVRVG